MTLTLPPLCFFVIIYRDLYTPDLNAYGPGPDFALFTRTSPVAPLATVFAAFVAQVIAGGGVPESATVEFNRVVNETTQSDKYIRKSILSS